MFCSPSFPAMEAKKMSRKSNAWSKPSRFGTTETSDILVKDQCNTWNKELTKSKGGEEKVRGGRGGRAGVVGVVVLRLYKQTM